MRDCIVTHMKSIRWLRRFQVAFQVLLRPRRIAARTRNYYLSKPGRRSPSARSSAGQAVLSLILPLCLHVLPRRNSGGYTDFQKGDIQCIRIQQDHHFTHKARRPRTEMRGRSTCYRRTKATSNSQFRAGFSYVPYRIWHFGLPSASGEGEYIAKGHIKVVG